MTANLMCSALESYAMYCYLADKCLKVQMFKRCLLQIKNASLTSQRNTGVQYHLKPETSWLSFSIKIQTKGSARPKLYPISGSQKTFMTIMPSSGAALHTSLKRQSRIQLWFQLLRLWPVANSKTCHPRHRSYLQKMLNLPIRRLL